jgi:asparagine synthase (glutamine-hydrolysing)
MCGIFTVYDSSHQWQSIEQSFNKISYRGPDSSSYIHINDKLIMAFHRLAIMGVSDSGNQPMKHPDDESITLMCNGEIYNFKTLAQKYNFNLSTGSDCEIILHLFKEVGIEKTIGQLDGVFMFTIYDEINDILYAGRDPMGVRPGFISGTDNGTFISSEAKSLIKYSDSIMPFPPGSWWSSESPEKFERYFYYDTNKPSSDGENEILKNVKSLLTEAVVKRLMSEREIGCLLSGGLDSSLIASIVSKNYSGDKLNTFSIGMEGSVDIKYAQVVADFIESNHHSIQISEKDFLDSIETVIYNIESYDTTTVRASVGNYLVSKYIKDNTDCKVIFNGDGSDEVCCGYLYLRNAPNSKKLQLESERLVKELYLYDVLRSDRSISSNGLEARTPFLDKKFVKYYLSIPAALKTFNSKNKIEKELLRKAFNDGTFLPEDVLWRRKVAFSDGVSSQKKSWHKIIQDHVDQKITDKEFSDAKIVITHCTPLLKESYYYRKIFESFFPNSAKLIPHFWMPKWSDTIDPSARELEDYRE